MFVEAAMLFIEGAVGGGVGGGGGVSVNFV